MTRRRRARRRPRSTSGWADAAEVRGRAGCVAVGEPYVRDRGAPARGVWLVHVRGSVEYSMVHNLVCGAPTPYLESTAFGAMISVPHWTFFVVERIRLGNLSALAGSCIIPLYFNQLCTEDWTMAAGAAMPMARRHRVIGLGTNVE